MDVFRNRGSRGLWRSRWAAIGAAVAVTLGAGGLFVVNAASSTPSAFVSIDPVRILDTRDPTNVGLSGPFVSAVPLDLIVTGTVVTTTGNKVVVPTGATAVSMNVTVVTPTANGFVSIRPADAPGLPSVSSLNFNAGDIVPNAVTVQLPTAGADQGKIEVTYDAYGTPGPSTDILVDVNGYYTDSALADLASRVAALEGQTVALDGAQPFAVSSRNDGATVPQSDTLVESVSVTAPVDGHVTVNSSLLAEVKIPGDALGCSITSLNTIDSGYLQYWDSSGVSGSEGSHAQMAGTRTFAVSAGQIGTYNLICYHYGTGSPSSQVGDPVLTAIFTPAP